MAKSALGVAVEIALGLVIVCLMAAIAGVWWGAPVLEAELGKSRALDQLLAVPVPSVPGRTCGSLVNTAGQANAARASWEVSRQGDSALYVVTVTFLRGEDRASFHWMVDPANQKINSLDKRSICPLP